MSRRGENGLPWTNSWVDILVHSPGSGCRPRTIRGLLRERAANRRAALSCLRFVSLRLMAIVTKRNAIVGFVTLKLARIVVRKRAKKLAQKLPARRKH